MSQAVPVKMVKVKALRSFNGQEGRVTTGDILELRGARLQSLIRNRYVALIVETPAEVVSVDPLEETPSEETPEEDAPEEETPTKRGKKKRAE